MSDLYDEKIDINSTKTLVIKLREHYLDIMKENNKMDIDERQRCTKLAMNFPDETLIRQIIQDLVKLILNHDIEIRKIRW